MRWSNRYLTLSLMVSAALTTVSLAQEPAATEKKPTAAKKSASKKKKDEPAPTALDRLIPIGKSSEKVTLPSFNETGQLTSLINIDRVTRLDADRFSLHGLTLMEYDPTTAPKPSTEAAGDKKNTAQPTTRMDLLDGVLLQSSQTIISDRRSRIVKPEFEIVGDSLNYRASDGVGHMRGRVQLLLRDNAASPTKKNAPKPQQ
jgi:hypothetical protein